MNKNIIKNLIVIALGFLVGLYGVGYLLKSPVGAPQTATTDTIGTLRVNVNTLATEFSNFGGLSSSTGNLIVGSSSVWRVLSVGAAGRVLTASSSASGGIAWEPAAAGAGTVSTSSAVSVNNFPYWFTASALSGTSTLVYNAGTLEFSAASTFNGQISYTSSTASRCLRTNGSQILVSSGVDCLDTGGRSITLSGTTIDTDAELYTTSKTVVVINPDTTVHSTGTVAFIFPTESTLTSIRCHSTPSGTSTIRFDRRASSTPLTFGTNILSSLGCGSSSSTTTFATSTMTAGSILNIKFETIAGAPSSSVIYVDYTLND